MSEDIEEQLCKVLQKTSFSFKWDDTTSNCNALLMAYARYIVRRQKIIEGLFFSKYVETDTKGQKLYQTLVPCLPDKSIRIKCILACDTDGDAAVVGRYCRFL